MYFRVIAELPASAISKKYREMWFSSDEIVSFYNFTNDSDKEQTCIRLKDGSVVITESSVLEDIKNALKANNTKIVPLSC